MSATFQGQPGSGEKTGTAKATGTFTWQLVRYFEANTFSVEWNETAKHWQIFAAKGAASSSDYGDFTLQIPAESEQTKIIDQTFTVGNGAFTMGGRVSTRDQHGDVTVKTYRLEGSATVNILPGPKSFSAKMNFRTIVNRPEDPDYSGSGEFNLTV